MEEEKVPGQEPVWQHINAAQQKGPGYQAQVLSNCVCFQGRVLHSVSPVNNGGAVTVRFLSVRLDLGIRTQRVLRGEEWGKAEGIQMLEAGDGE